MIDEKMPNRTIIATITVFISIIVALILSECLLRMLGFEPWRYRHLDTDAPTLYEYDPVLGWRNKPGKYVLGPYHPAGKPVHMTFYENGHRLTGIDSETAGGDIVIVGGSYSQGLAVSDSETYAWKLQEKYPSLRVVNYGTGGYGGYQSLLVLERELPRMASPKIVLYGFIGHHEVRNVVPESWLRRLSSHSRSRRVSVPYATFDENRKLVRHPPETYLSFPFRETSALVALIEQACVKLRSMDRYKQRKTVSEAVLLQMDKVSRKNGATLIVVILQCKKYIKEHYINFLKQKNIQFIDSASFIPKKMRVKGEGHPNGNMHTIWARKISSVLDDQVKEINSHNQQHITTHRD
jgi:hypothetical protein